MKPYPEHPGDMQPAETRPTSAVLRRLLERLLCTEADFNAFCLDYCAPVYQRFAAGMDRIQKTNLLFERCQSGQILVCLKQHFQDDPGALTLISHLVDPPASEEARHGQASWDALDRLYIQREELLRAGESTEEVDRELVSIKRAQRRRSQLGEGEVLKGRYRLIERIGRGGFGNVWRAFDRESKFSVAVKILHGEDGEDPRRVERFERGARQLKRLSHPNIVRVFDGPSEHGEFLYFVMEYLPGGDLFRALNERRIESTVALQVILQVCDALAYAHQRGLIHRG